MTLRILGIDPGTIESAYTIIDVDNRIKWIKSGMFKNLVENVDANTQINARPFIRDMRKLLKTYKPDIVIMESFFLRSNFRSNLGLPINFMMGIVCHMCERRSIKYSAIPPNTWKRKLEKDFIKVDDLYDLTYPIKQRLPPHVIDSFFQALFASGEQCYKTLKLSQIETIKEVLKKDITLRENINYVRNKKEERLKVKRLKKKKKQPKKK